MTTSSQWKPQDNIPRHIQNLLNQSHPSNLNYINAFYQIVSLLKEQKRTGWLDFNVSEPESIADHMYRMSIISMSLNSDNFSTTPDLTKACKIALIHDIAEALVGDITPRDLKIDKIEKNRRELATINYLSDIIKPYNPKFSNEIVELWLDYENQRNFEAKIVKDVDKYELIIQTWENERRTGKDLSEFIDSSIGLIKTKEIQSLANEVINQRAEYFKENPRKNKII